DHLRRRGRGSELGAHDREAREQRVALAQLAREEGLEPKCLRGGFWRGRLACEIGVAAVAREVSEGEVGVMESDRSQREAIGEGDLPAGALLVRVGEASWEPTVAHGRNGDRERRRLRSDTHRRQKGYLSRDRNAHRDAWARSERCLVRAREEVAARGGR